MKKLALLTVIVLVLLLSAGCVVPSSWESYSDLAHTTVCNNFEDYDTEHTIYMLGQGFYPDWPYKVIFWDEVDSIWQQRRTERSIADGNGELIAQHELLDSVDTPGIWYAAVYYDPNYNPSEYDPDDAYMVVADDFEVQETAIPEFSTIISGIVVMGLCCLIYFWMRKRRLAYVRI